MEHLSASALVAIVSAILTSLPGSPAMAQPVSVERVAAIGCLLCEGPEAFGAIQAIAISPVGTVIVADRDAPMIRTFDAQGQLVSSFGRRGEGPGEFGMPVGVAARPEGRILVGDIRRLYLSEMAADGELLRSIRVPSTVMTLNGAPAGDWVTYQTANWSDFTATVQLLDQASDSAGTPLPSTGGVVLDAQGNGAAPGLLNSVPGPEGKVAVGFGGVEYRILILDREGAKMHEIVREIPRTPRTPEEISALEEAFRRGPGGGLRADNPEAGATPRPVDPLRPHFPMQSFSWDSKGRLWVRTSRGMEDETLFDLFGPSGGWLGEVAIPATVHLHATGNGTLATVVRDPATEVDQVVLWRIVG